MIKLSNLSVTSLRNILTHKISFQSLLPAIAFCALLIWGWRITNPFYYIPSYDDALEVIWGIEFYHQSLYENHTSPLFTDLIFYPKGFYTSALAHTPALFLLAQPLRWIGGAAFAYNVLVLLSQVVIFVGAHRFLRLYVNGYSALIAALMLSFWNFRWFRMGGHVNILWSISLLIWMAYFLVRWRNNQISDKKISILVGLLWGLMINFSLYSIFIGGWSALLLGGKRGIKNFIVSAFIALLLGSGTILSYYLSASQNEISNFGYSHLVYWGASLNSFAVPSTFHPIEQVRNLSRELYKGPHDESGVANAGIVTFVLVMVGIVAIFRKGDAKKYAYLFLLSLVGGVFALGPLLRWDGQIVSNCAFEPITNAIWQVGHALKPKLFEPSPPPGMNCGVPLPGLWLGSFIPFLEGARVSSRYMFVAVLGLIPIATIGLSIFRPSLKVLFIALWLLEFLPNPIYGVPLDNQVHPVYTYVAQNLQTDEGIIEVTAAGMHMNGDVLYTSILSNVPTANGYGAFWPKHTMDLWLYFLNRPSRWQEEETISLLRQNRIRYVLVYRIGKQEEDLIATIQQGPELQFEGCFDPLPNQSLRKFPICVFEVVDKEAYLTRTTGWSERESWGIWAQGTESQMNLVVSQPTDLVLSIRATPLCVEGKNQTITIFVNNVLLSEHLWQDCNIWSDRVQIPSSILQPGSNDVLLRYSYAARPVDVTNGQNTDPRSLSVGFLEMRVEKTGDGSR